MVDTHNKLRITFFALKVRDMGNYSCQAENSQGRARDHIELSGEYIQRSAKVDAPGCVNPAGKIWQK